MNKQLFNLFAFLIFSFTLQAQYKISGKVTTDGEPLIGANVLIKGTTKGVVTNFDGDYVLYNLDNGKYTLLFSYGGTPSETQVNINGKDVILNHDISFTLNTITVNAITAKDDTPATFTNLDKEKIEANNLGQDVPFLLKWTPSTVVTSDAGAGIGYTGIRIRGSDPSRTNVTINGIPLNDAESQGVFWVDLPDFASSTDVIQIQRGVGTSTNGAGAFGASINLQTNQTKSDPYAKIGTTLGSFNTRKANVNVGSGLIKDKFTFDARLSKIDSDGYIDRASSDLSSYFVSGAYVGDKTSLRLNLFSGHEITYQAWYGIDALTLEEDRTNNPAGIRADGTYHDNQVDNYKQTHYQALFNQVINASTNLDLALHYTKGKGFFEEYEIDDDLADYNIPDVEVGGTVVTTSDLIRRRWLDNDFYGLTYALNYGKGNLETTLGGAYNIYQGLHFGEIKWARFASSVEQNHRYYDNDATKNDFNIFLKTNYRFTNRLNAYLDLQFRTVNYEFLGFDNDGTNVTQNASLNFFNPKVGLFYDAGFGQLYGYFGIANREPNRSDYTESTPNSRPKPERLLNTEIGYKKNWNRGALSVNFYHMFYKDQLAVTGQINDVGEYSRRNLDKSTRMGIEIEGGYELISGLTLSGNATFSSNKVAAWTEYIDNWDTWEQDPVEHKDTDLAFSPSIITGIDLSYDALKNTSLSNQHSLTFSLSNKYVGKQFIDNTSNEEAALDAYSYSDFKIAYRVQTNFLKAIELKLMARNIFDSLYENNAWSYHYSSGGSNAYLIGYYPQAGRNFLAGLSIEF